MIIVNPQWQGSGLTDEVRIGTSVLASFFDAAKVIEVELSTQELTIENGIIGYKAIYEQLERFANIVEAFSPKTITTLAGDCGAEVIPVSYLNSNHENLAVIWLDAHADLNTPETSPSKTFHGMPVRLLLGDGDPLLKKLLFSTLAPHQVLFIGLRDTDPPEEEYIAKHSLFRSLKIDLPKIAAHLRSHRLDKVYIHLDLDVFDPQDVPFTKCPSPNGIRIKEVEEFIRQLHCEFEVVGYGITECTAKSVEEIKALSGLIDVLKESIT